VGPALSWIQPPALPKALDAIQQLAQFCLLWRMPAKRLSLCESIELLSFAQRRYRPGNLPWRFFWMIRLRMLLEPSRANRSGTVRSVTPADARMVQAERPKWIQNGTVWGDRPVGVR
jgi:hypothetical protein